MIFNKPSFEITPSPLDASGLFRPWVCLFPLPSLASVLPFLARAAQYTLSGTHFSTPKEWSFPQKIYWLFTKYRQLHPLSLTLNLPGLDSGLLFCSPLIRWACLDPHGHSRVTWKACWNTNLVTLLLVFLFQKAWEGAKILHFYKFPAVTYPGNRLSALQL